MTNELPPVTAFVEDFRSSGFGIIRQAISSSYADELRAHLEALLGQIPAGEPRPLQRLLPRLVERDRRFLDIAVGPPLIAIMEEIFGATPHLICSYGHDKPATTAAHTGPHSDVGHLPGVCHDTSTLMVKVMVALTPVHLGSGPTTLYPGSHRGAPPTAEIPAIVEPGDLLMFHSNIRHTATANSTDRSRLGLWYVYALPWMKAFPGFEFDTEFLDSIKPLLSAEPQLRGIFGLEDPYATRPMM